MPNSSKSKPLKGVQLATILFNLIMNRDLIDLDADKSFFDYMSFFDSKILLNKDSLERVLSILTFAEERGTYAHPHNISLENFITALLQDEVIFNKRFNLIEDKR